jgi:hypothetical protein
MAIQQVLWRTLAVLGMALFVTGCAPSSTTSTHFTITDGGLPPCPTESMSSDGPSYCPLILKDTSPSELALSLTLIIGGYDASTRDITELNVTFTHQGRLVRFMAGEQIACNGIALPGYGSNFNLKVPSVVFSGKLVTCIYTSGTTSATFSFTAPLAPTILSPQENAQITRSSRTRVSYRLSPDWAYYVIALGPPKKAWTPEAPAQPNPVLLDTSAFSPGAGSIAIHQFFTVRDLSGPDFQSVQEQEGDAIYAIQVTWV